MPTNPTTAQDRSEQSLKKIDFSGLTQGRPYYPSPAAWEDQVLYFLLVDRFSDGSEYSGFADTAGQPVVGPGGNRTTPLFDLGQDAGKADRATWFEAGKKWCGGTLAGLTDKIGYLRRLGVTAIWLSPIFRQVTGSQDYHGYGIQNFLDVDPHFGTRQDLRDFVAAAHQQHIRVVLDIILNHAGDVFAYQGGYPYYYCDGCQWPVKGYRKNSGDSGNLPFRILEAGDAASTWPQGAVWPREFQDAATWTRQGEINEKGGWDRYPEFIDGDFKALKDIDHGWGPKDPSIAWDLFRRITEFQDRAALWHLTTAYKFWIAYADLDGYRIDTVKHMEPGAVRLFANAIHEFAQSLGKENFYLIGEVTGGRTHAVHIVETTGIDAALGIDDIQDKLEFLAKGWRNPGDPQTDDQEGYFDLFRNSLVDYKNTHQWFGKHIVTMFDDHDQVGTKHKFRFCGQAGGYRYLIPALALNLTTMGIPCLYYGTEQGFNGADPRAGDDDWNSDVFLRECMFGGPFGSLQSTGRHFFNENHEVYQFLQTLCRLRQEHLALRRGRQYQREVSASGAPGDFHYPKLIGNELHWVIAWSRIFADQEYLCAVNTNADQALTVWATVDQTIHPPAPNPPGGGPAGTMQCLFSTDPAQTGSTVTVEPRNGSAIKITVPAAGFVVYR